MWLDSRATPKDRVVDHQENAGADHSDENAVQIQARDACHAKSFEQETAQDSTDDAEDDVENHPLSGLIDDFARDESRDRPQHDPSNE
jgi:hypothetical protein